MTTKASKAMPPARHLPQAPNSSRELGAESEIGAHWHDGNQIVYASKGVLAVHTDTSRWIIPANRAIWIPGGIVHAHRMYGATTLHLVGLPTSSDPIGLGQPTVFAVSPLVRELMVAYADLGDDTMNRRGRQLLALLLDELRLTAEHPVQVPVPSDPRLQKLCAMLEADPSDNRNLDALGRRVGASSRTLARLFRNDMAMTFPQWRTQLRIYHALCLLAEGHPVKTVARRCGFGSSSSFIDVFRRSLGYSPGAYALSFSDADRGIPRGESGSD